MCRPRLLLCLAILFASSSATRAEELIWATGQVKNESGRPVSGATVAIYDDRNHVIDYAKTDPEGNYALAVPRGTLHLDKKGGDFFHKVTSAFGGVTRVAAMPLKMGIRAAAGVATAADPLTRIGIGTASGVAQGLVDVMAPPERRSSVPLRQQPGVVLMKVTAPGQNDVVSLARVYWMEEQEFRTGGKVERVVTTWVDPVKLTDAASSQPSAFDSTYLTFKDARLEPSIAEPGTTVSLIVHMSLPPEPRTPIVVVARNNVTGMMYELERMDRGVYGTDIVVDKKFPKNDQTFTILAYAEQDDRPGRSRKVEDAVVHSGLFDPRKPFLYNPLLVVSRNRAEATLTVVQSRKRR